MDVRSLAEWHRAQAERTASRARVATGGLNAKTAFHTEAAQLVESLSDNERDRLLIEIERDVKLRAIESLEKLAKSLIVEAKELRRMLSEDISDE